MKLIKDIYNLIKRYWFGLILSGITIYAIISHGIWFILSALFGMGLFIYGMLKNHMLNAMVRSILQQRVIEDGQKQKQKTNYYKKQAEKEAVIIEPLSQKRR